MSGAAARSGKMKRVGHGLQQSARHCWYGFIVVLGMKSLTEVVSRENGRRGIGDHEWLEFCCKRIAEK